MNWSNFGNRSQLYLYYLIAGISIIFILINGKVDSFLKLYSFHSDFLNSIMKGITFLGDGIFALFFAFIFIFYKLRISIFLMANWLISGLLAQILKRYIFTDELRPLAFFKQLGINIYQVPGIELHSYHSFPSGHTATAFALFFGLSLFVKNQWYKASLLLFATLIGFSRIYLGQHFPADVIAGSVIGIFTSIFLFSRLTNWTSPFLEKNIQMIVRKL